MSAISSSVVRMTQGTKPPSQSSSRRASRSRSERHTPRNSGSSAPGALAPQAQYQEQLATQIRRQFGEHDYSYQMRQKEGKSSAGVWHATTNGADRDARRASIANLVLVITEMLNESKKKLVLRPDTRMMEKWDILMIFMLAFVSIAGPFELAMLRFDLTTPRGIALFAINRLVDVVFLIDMGLNFFLSYPAPKHVGGWVRDHKQIVQHYLRGWFLIDLVSVIPFDLIVVAINGEPDGSNQLRATRLVRLLRLLKLLRILRASRLWRRLEARMTVSYAVINICKFLVLMFVFSHWSACLWVLVAVLEPSNQKSWVTKWYESRTEIGLGPANVEKCLAQLPSYYEKKLLDNDIVSYPSETYNVTEANFAIGQLTNRNAAHWHDCYFINELYLVSGYWSVMTLTTIGYGDVVPVNTTEHGFCTLIMLIGGCIWAYILGSICAAAANLDPHTTEFQCTMDELNRFMRERAIPTPHQNRFREFFIGSRGVMHSRAARGLMTMMSPSLAAECVMHTQQSLLNGKVFFLKDCPSEFCVDIVMRMGDSVFGPQEMLNARDSLVVLKRGIVTVDGYVVLPEATWGEDIIFDQAWLRFNPSIFSMTLVEISSLPRGQLLELLQQAPAIHGVVRKNTAPYILIRAMKIAGILIREGRCEPTKEGIMRAFWQRVHNQDDSQLPNSQVPFKFRMGNAGSSGLKQHGIVASSMAHVLDTNLPRRTQNLASAGLTGSDALADGRGVVDDQIGGQVQPMRKMRSLTPLETEAVEVFSGAENLIAVNDLQAHVTQLEDSLSRQAEENRRLGQQINFLIQKMYADAKEKGVMDSKGVARGATIASPVALKSRTLTHA